MKVDISEFFKNKPRKVKVDLIEDDVWNLDQTLAHIVHPPIILLKEKKQGIFAVDYKDVPAKLSKSYNPNDGTWYNEAACNYVFYEIIWAMSQIKDDICVYDGKATLEEYEKHEKRVQNGCELFGKYFRDLWC